MLSVLVARWMTHDAELAMRLVSLVAGLALIPVVFILGTRVHSRAAGLIAAALAAVWGPLVLFSVLTYAEMLYALLTTLALVALLATADDTSPRRQGVWAGLWLGLAYLCRPEAALLVIVAAAWLWRLVRRGDEPGRALAVAMRPLLIFALFFVLNLVLLRAQTGAWQLPKATYNLLLEIVPARVTLNADHTAVLAGPQVEGSPLAYLAAHPAELVAKAARNTWTMLHSMLTRVSWIGGWMLVGYGLCALGACRRRGGDLLLWWFLPLAVLPFFLTVVLRIYAWLLPPLLVLMAAGVLLLARQCARPASRRAWALMVMLMLMIPAIPSGLKPPEPPEAAQGRLVKETGEALRARFGPGHDILAPNEVPFYAQGRWWRLPEDPPAAIVDFINRAGIEFVILDTQNAAQRPLLRLWFAGQVPSNWRLVHEAISGSAVVRAYHVGR